MATITQTVQYNHHVPAPDVMDLHSESELDFGDEDVDLDLQSSTRPYDDDLSIYDAADAGLEVQTVTTDHDDFMVDNDDLIEEDPVHYGDDDVTITEAEQPGTTVADTVNMDDDVTITEAEQPETAGADATNMEDDVIEYSDDEEDTTWNSNEQASAPADVGLEDATEQQSEDRVADKEPVKTNDGADGVASEHGKTNPEDDTHADNDDFPEFGEPDESHLENGDTTTYAEQPAGREADQHDQNAHDQLDVAHPPHDDAADNAQPDQESEELDSLPVTVNYDSTELWLFKHHDFDDSGDFLVEDGDLAGQPLSSLLEGCRVALGPDVADEVELGFRLDNFHNIELYQDHTSCAFVTLEHLVNLYQQLHIQDGVANPESFYMTLLFRPRVSALLGELSKAAAEGIGHSGLSRAIASGLTAFNAHSSHNSTDHVPEDWDNDEEQQGDDAYEEVGPSEEAGHVGESNGDDCEDDEHSYEAYNEEGYQEQYEETTAEPHSPSQVQSVDQATSAPEASPTTNESAAADPKSSTENATSDAQPFVKQSRSHSQQASPISHHDDDIIEYSDDELEPEVDTTNPGKAIPESSSSTVQGDNVVQAHVDEASANVHNEDQAEDGAAHDHPGDEYEGDYTWDQGNQPSHEGFEDAFGDEYVGENGEAQESGVAGGELLQDYASEDFTQMNDETTNQYDDVEYRNVDPPADSTQAEHGDESSHFPVDASAVEHVSAVDKFLDFDTVASDVHAHTNGEAEAYNEDDVLEFDDDDEDGAAGQAPVAPSADAKAVDTLSSEHLEMSPQGQKRTIDQVGIDVSEATGSSGMLLSKRRKLSHETDWLDQMRSELECRLPPFSPSSIDRYTNSTAFDDNHYETVDNRLYQPGAYPSTLNA
jgi:hypothetical protein